VKTIPALLDWWWLWHLFKLYNKYIFFENWDIINIWQLIMAVSSTLLKISCLLHGPTASISSSDGRRAVRGQGSIFRRKPVFRYWPVTKNFRNSGIFRIFRSENDLKFKFRFSTFSDRISVFSDRKMLLVIGNCKISEEKLKNLQHFV